MGLCFKKWVSILILIGLVPCFASAEDSQKACIHQQLIRRMTEVRNFRQEFAAYWKKELEFLSTKLKQRPWSRIEDGARFTLKNGLKVAFAPTVIILDVPRAVGRGIGAAVKQRSASRLLLIPVDITQRNGVHLLGYTVLAAAGISAPFTISKMITTNEDDLKKVTSDTLDLKEDEIVVFAYTSEDEQMIEGAEKGHKKYLLKPLTKKEMELLKQWQEAKLPDEKKKEFSEIYNKILKSEEQLKGKVLFLEASTPEDLLFGLGEARQYGRIKDLQISAHGSPGGFNLQSHGFLDFSEYGKDLSSGDVDLNAMKRLSAIPDSLWPEDLFAPNARVMFLSCSVGKGEAGRNFMEKFGTVALKEGGMVIAPTHDFYARTNEEAESIRKSLLPKNLDVQEIQYAAEMHFGVLGYMTLMDAIKADTYTDLLNAVCGEPDPKVRVIQIPKKEKAKSPEAVSPLKTDGQGNR